MKQWTVYSRKGLVAQLFFVAVAMSALALPQAEPPLQEVLDRSGYSINAQTDEIPAQLFVRADKSKPVTHKAIAAFGVETANCSAGWYRPGDQPTKNQLWVLEKLENKKYNPKMAEGGATEFDPGNQPFGLWVSSTNFKGETVYTEDKWQKMISRFGKDLHKAHVYPAKTKDGTIPNTYVIGWEYSTNNDNQDVVTLVSNVKPAKAK